jgi:hypothetical protein
MQRTLISSLAMVAALMSVGNGAFAHDDGALDKISGPNGGQLRMAGSYHFELVVAKDSKEAKDNPVNGLSHRPWRQESPRDGRYRYSNDPGREIENHGTAGCRPATTS